MMTMTRFGCSVLSSAAVVPIVSTGGIAIALIFFRKITRHPMRTTLHVCRHRSHGKSLVVAEYVDTLVGKSLLY
jgi:hypothetical protein